jgi:hypothetical protein
MTIIQKPNKLLIIMLMGVLVATITTGFLHSLGNVVYIIAGSMWSYLEITDGVNMFRRLLGIFVLLMISYGLFMYVK